MSQASDSHTELSLCLQVLLFEINQAYGVLSVFSSHSLLLHGLYQVFLVTGASLLVFLYVRVVSVELLLVFEYHLFVLLEVSLILLEASLEWFEKSSAKWGHSLLSIHPPRDHYHAEISGRYRQMHENQIKYSEKLREYHRFFPALPLK